MEAQYGRTDDGRNSGNGSVDRSGQYPVLRAGVLVSQIVRAIAAPAAILYAIIWREFQLQWVHVGFVALCIIVPILIEQGFLRAPEMAAMLRAWRGLPEAPYPVPDHELEHHAAGELAPEEHHNPS